MSNSLWTTLQKIGINLVPIRPSNPLLHPSVHGYPIKKCIQFYLAFEKREQEKRRDLPYQNHAITHFHTWDLAHFGIVSWLCCYACLTDRRKTSKNLVDSRKNWKILTVSRK